MRGSPGSCEDIRNEGLVPCVLRGSESGHSCSAPTCGR